MLGILVASAAVVGVATAANLASSKISARVTPKHINPRSIATAKYTWKASGTLTYGEYCPNGTHVVPYCSNLPTRAACKGTVSWVAKLGQNELLADSGKKIGSGKTKINSKCGYVFSHRFRTKDFIAKSALHNASSMRHVGVRFYISFGDNSVLKSSKARQQTVVAKVLEPGT